MATEKIEFEFPDPDDSTEIEIEPGSATTLGDDAAPKDDAPAEDSSEADLDIEVVDDTPEEDRNRKPAPPPDEVSDEELQEYSEKVQARIKKFTRGYHDERRAKEAMQRERDELEAMTRKLLDENRQLKGSFGKTREALLEQGKRSAAEQLEAAKRAYKDAYESGDSDALLEAQDKLISAKQRISQLDNVKFEPLQEDLDDVKPQVEPDVPAQQQPVVDERAKSWAEQNTWFGQDEEMTAYALGLHQKLVRQGVDPKSDEYYDAIDSRMRQLFPDQVGGNEEDKSPPEESVVAPATRTRSPKKIRLTKTQVALAKRLGVPLDVYAKQVAEEMRKAKNG